MYAVLTVELAVLCNQLDESAGLCAKTSVGVEGDGQEAAWSGALYICVCVVDALDCRGVFCCFRGLLFVLELGPLFAIVGLALAAGNGDVDVGVELCKVCKGFDAQGSVRIRRVIQFLLMRKRYVTFSHE